MVSTRFCPLSLEVSNAKVMLQYVEDISPVGTVSLLY